MKSGSEGLLRKIERIGNKIPHPFFLFVWLIVIVAVSSFLLNTLQVSVQHPSTGEIIFVKNIVSAEGLVYALDTLVKNFINFVPLGMTLTLILGVGMSEDTGFMSALMRKTILGAPKGLLTFTIALIGICGNLASDAAIIIIPAIAAMIFLSLGRHPIAGIALAYAATTGGFSANLFIANTDANLAGITNAAVKIVGGPEIPIVANWYIMVVSSFLLAWTISVISEKIIEPRLGEYKGTKQATTEHELSPEEKIGLKAAGISAIVYLIIVGILAIPQNAILRTSGSRLPILPLLLFFFLITTVTYGFKSGSIKSAGEIPKLMEKAIAKMSPFIVLSFIIGQFIAYFSWTNIGIVLAVSGASFLKSIGLTGAGLFIGYVVLCSFINIFIGSGSAKWSLLAPIFIPMFSLLGYHPAWTQFLYRIGDSTTNIISPLFTYFPIILAVVQDYDENKGIGTLLSLMLPYSIGMFIVWIVFSLVWYYLGFPLGPGGLILM